jgi:hypothetical protein
MHALPSFRICVDLLLLRRRLPRMLEREPLDILLGRLESWRPTWRRHPPLARDRVEASITVSEAFVLRLGFANTCLYRSMARYAVLRSQGVPALFRMGVHPPPDETGHAWVEDEDGPYREEIEEGQYVITFSHPEGSCAPAPPTARATSSNFGPGPGNELIKRRR